MELTHILLVEDNEGDILLTTEALEENNLGKRISVVKDGKEALDFLFKEGKFNNCETPDLILLDINLPKKNGMEVLEIIKKTQSLNQIPVIVLSTSSSLRDRELSSKNKIDCFISKADDAHDISRVMDGIRDFWIGL